jgi:hypothetical protein
MKVLHRQAMNNVSYKQSIIYKKKLGVSKTDVAISYSVNLGKSFMSEMSNKNSQMNILWCIYVCTCLLNSMDP